MLICQRIAIRQWELIQQKGNVRPNPHVSILLALNFSLVAVGNVSLDLKGVLRLVCLEVKLARLPLHVVVYAALLCLGSVDQDVPVLSIPTTTEIIGVCLRK